jgi:NAD(P)-dependent dehydrogenase (short-subunit alcohol dehydrogenase family)
MTEEAAMDELRFEGRVAIVTGAGRGLGRAYALLLARRGACVVVNDTGGAPDGSGGDAGPAAAVVAEIRAAGGEAVACTASVADREGAQAIVRSAVDAFGGVDTVINNAGILRAEDFATVSLEDFMRVTQVGLFGSFLVTQAAWPQLIASGHGRVVMTVSAALFGVAPLPSYSVSKAGIVGLARSLAQLGAPDGIKVNIICPTATTRLVGDPELRRRSGVPTGGAPADEGRGTPDDVAPMAAVLAHERCPVTGEILACSGAHSARIFLGVTPGLLQPGGSPEDLLEHWDAIMDPEGYAIPATSAEYAAGRARAFAGEAPEPGPRG